MNLSKRESASKSTYPERKSIKNKTFHNIKELDKSQEYDRTKPPKLNLDSIFDSSKQNLTYNMDITNNSSFMLKNLNNESNTESDTDMNMTQNEYLLNDISVNY